MAIKTLSFHSFHISLSRNGLDCREKTDVEGKIRVKECRILGYYAVWRLHKHS
jgi:hypothetical protein